MRVVLEAAVVVVVVMLPGRAGTRWMWEFSREAVVGVAEARSWGEREGRSRVFRIWDGLVLGVGSRSGDEVVCGVLVVYIR